ncbi:cytidylate kinase [Longilinea arvoryzae]|uniref:Cytidylate kinase n=1 Tax=Longilinea arvoryzae TaxID=360412 RepID=A0A0S7BIY7_9CHLR|nr:(d)CMP kinase [Longilinea arvoryzae]GAP14422.1 cytidylate kinase [Longilinea arvoryzae]
MIIPSIIAIDGPAASGKSTVGVLLANRLNYLFFDTGIMYRAVTWAALQRLHAVDDEVRVTGLAEQVQIDVQPPTRADGRQADVLLDGLDITWNIRRPEVDANVSQVSAYRGVRTAMTKQQRRVGQRGQVVMVGRDIGTVVLPEAELKIYLDASAEERARRRFEELRQRGEAADYEKILDAMKKRDKFDSTREVAPLRAAEDAVRICSDGISAEGVVDRILEIIRIQHE